MQQGDIAAEMERARVDFHLLARYQALTGTSLDHKPYYFDRR
jgi:hypothetical protein